MDESAPTTPTSPRPAGESAPESAVLTKLDRLETMLARITGPAEVTSGKPPRVLTKQALRREQGLTHLYRAHRSGIFIWRRKDELRGRVVQRSTKTRDESIAILIGANFEREYQRRRAGLRLRLLRKAARAGRRALDQVPRRDRGGA